MIKHIRVEYMIGCTSIDDVDDLFGAAFVETDSGFDGDARVVIGADYVRVIFVDGAGVIYGIVDDVVIQALFLNRAVDGFVIDQIAARRVDERCVRFHGAKMVVSNDGIISREVEGDGVALFEKGFGIVDNFGIVLCGNVCDVGANVVDEETTGIAEDRTGAFGHFLANAAETPDAES